MSVQEEWGPNYPILSYPIAKKAFIAGDYVSKWVLSIKMFMAIKVDVDVIFPSLSLYILV